MSFFCFFKKNREKCPNDKWQKYLNFVQKEGSGPFKKVLFSFYTTWKGKSLVDD